MTRDVPFGNGLFLRPNRLESTPSQVFISLVDELATDRCRDAWDLGYVRRPIVKEPHS